MRIECKLLMHLLGDTTEMQFTENWLLKGITRMIGAGTPTWKHRWHTLLLKSIQQLSHSNKQDYFFSVKILHKYIEEISVCHGLFSDVLLTVSFFLLVKNKSPSLSQVFALL